MKAHLVIALGLALGLAIVVLLVAPAPASEAAIVCQRYVAVAGNNSGDFSDEGKPCQAVQYAIDQSAKGDRICVSSDMWSLAPTVYYEHITIDHPVILDGKWESECPVGAACSFYPMDRCAADRIELDGFGQGRVITILPDTDPTIDCFTITGGDANGLGGDPEHTPNHAGGGIYLLKAGDETLISGNVVAGNVADESSWGQGGGIMLRDSGGTIEGNLITENRAGHSAGYGGGIAIVGGTPLITGNEVWDNVAGQATQGLGGGGHQRQNQNQQSQSQPSRLHGTPPRVHCDSCDPSAKCRNGLCETRVLPEAELLRRARQAGDGLWRRRRPSAVGRK